MYHKTLRRDNYNYEPFDQTPSPPNFWLRPKPEIFYYSIVQVGGTVRRCRKGSWAITTHCKYMRLFPVEIQLSWFGGSECGKRDYAASSRKPHAQFGHAVYSLFWIQEFYGRKAPPRQSMIEADEASWSKLRLPFFPRQPTLRASTHFRGEAECVWPAFEPSNYYPVMGRQPEQVRIYSDSSNVKSWGLNWSEFFELSINL